MALVRPVVSVYKTDEVDKTDHATVMPTVFQVPLRPDLVRFVHTNIAKNRRQAYAVSPNSGYQTSAESWGTGRAVARIPRVSGGGTHRAGQGAFGNMCRGGGMFAPTKVWRRWHRKVNLTQRRHALASAIAASAVPALVMARGHRINEIPELPLVVENSIQGVAKTKEAVKILNKLGCQDDLQKVEDSRKIRSGKGKMRNRRYVMRRGPLVVYEEDNGVSRAFRNIPGVELCRVDRLNLLQVAPGGSLGRLIVWSEGAFKQLEKIYGNYRSGAPSKKGYTLQRPYMTNADLAKIINSNEVQIALNPTKEPTKKRSQHKNPLKNHSAMGRLNPAARQMRKSALKESTVGTGEHKALQYKKRKNIVQAQGARKKMKVYKKRIDAAQ